MSALSGGVKRLLSEAGPAPFSTGYWETLDWSPDGSTIVAESSPYGADKSNSRTKEVSQEIGGVSCTGAEPAFLPDGSRIVYAVNGDLWSLGPDGANLVRLTNTGTRERNPSWRRIP